MFLKNKAFYRNLSKKIQFLIEVCLKHTVLYRSVSKIQFSIEMCLKQDTLYGNLCKKDNFL